MTQRFLDTLSNGGTNFVLIFVGAISLFLSENRMYM